MKGAVYMPKNSKSKIAANRRYSERVYTRSALLIPSGQIDKIKEAAAAAGQSVNAYILTATARRMAAEGYELITTVSALKAQQSAAEAPGEAQQPTTEE